ncbi:MAG: DUF4143 domain-containing protein [Propionibacteriaceae bacterium]|nr:DUF4143 domain-containing protein [Propionibacteriaceae bacterium]
MDKTYVPRFVDAALDDLLGELPALLLTGPRGCGKTTTASRRAKSVLRLDRADVAGGFAADPDAVLRAQAPPVLIDEWQRVPESLGAVKRAVDAGSDAGRFLVTGSVRSRLSGAGWPATGRIVPLAMFGLTAAELAGVPGHVVVDRLIGPDDPEPGTLPDAPDLAGYVDQIVRGGFPDAVGLSDLARAAWYEGYAEQLIRHDVAEVAAVRSPAALAALVRAVALMTADAPSMATLAEVVRVDQRTLRSYLDLLEDLRIIERLPAWGTNRLNRLVKTPKYHVVDPGLAAHLGGDDRAGLLLRATRLGHLMETHALAQLRPLLRLAAPAITACHLRDRNGEREVDLVLETAAGNLVGIEVKAANTATAHDARHLAWLRDATSDVFVRGFVLHTGAMTFPLGDRLWALPIAALWQRP